MSGDVARQFARTLTACAETFAAARYEVAFYDLTRAMRLAMDLGDPVRLRRVAEVARRQGRDLDTRAPMHRLSSRMALMYGYEGAHELAARTAEAEALIAEARIAEKRRGVASPQR